jgi:hypothetical protein
VKTLTAAILEEAVGLIELLRSHQLSEEEFERTVARLNAILLDPHWGKYAFGQIPELTPEEIVRRAFTYEPIRLPDST